jgi:hypothetical protein
LQAIQRVDYWWNHSVENSSSVINKTKFLSVTIQNKAAYKISVQHLYPMWREKALLNHQGA